MIFCDECINNQNLVLNIIQNSNQDEDIEQLHKKYPQVCKVCEPKVELYLKSIQHPTILQRKESLPAQKPEKQFNHKRFRVITGWYITFKCIFQIAYFIVNIPEVKSLWIDSVPTDLFANSFNNQSIIVLESIRFSYIYYLFRTVEYIVICYYIYTKPRLKILKTPSNLGKRQILQILLITAWFRFYLLAPIILYSTIGKKKKKIIIKEIDIYEQEKEEPAVEKSEDLFDSLTGIQSIFLSEKQVEPTVDPISKEFIIEPPKYFKTQETTGLEVMFEKIGINEKKSFFSWK